MKKLHIISVFIIKKVQRIIVATFYFNLESFYRYRIEISFSLGPTSKVLYHNLKKNIGRYSSVTVPSLVYQSKAVQHMAQRIKMFQQIDQGIIQNITRCRDHVVYPK